MKLIVKTQQVKEPLGDLYGIFFEDLNHAADGGLYAELVQNRSFEFAPIDQKEYHSLTAWEKIEMDGDANLCIETGNPVSHHNPHYLGIDVINPGTNVGVQNLGFNSGIPLVEGEQYYFTCYIKREQDLTRPVSVSFRSKEGMCYLKEEIYVDTEWKKYELLLTAPSTDYHGRLALTVEGRGKVYMDFVSLFPVDTFMGRRNGLRKDIALKLADLKPKFMRFPGGCLVHDGSLDPNARDAMYRWKNTIGPVEDRPARRSNWGYNQTLGLGYFEYFQFCEDIKAKPLPVLPGGWDPHHKRAVPLEQLGPWIQDALDLIEFATGDTTTTWGRKRAELGHPKPFDLEYIGIGNEEVGEEFFERYGYFHKAIREHYKEIKIINSSGPFAAGGEYERGWNSGRENQSDLMDEHYYASPEWFLANHHRYDNFKSEDPHVFLGEYASWGNTYYNALVEASYMIGLERNAKSVGLACYAPLLCNADYVNWKPDMIWFDNHRIFVTPNYYVQQLFMHHQGDHRLEIVGIDLPNSIAVSDPIDKIAGGIALGSNDNVVDYYDITVTNDDTKEILHFDSCTLNREMVEQELISIVWTNYSIKLKAREREGFKGFKVFFGKRDDKNRLFLELGGWQNQDAVLCEDIQGRNSCLSQYLITIEKEKEYEIELRIHGRKICSYVNGTLYHDIENLPVNIEPLYYSASQEEATGDVIVKVVNVATDSKNVDITLEQGLYLRGTIYELSGYKRDSENNFEQPELILPKERKIQLIDSSFYYTFEGESITIFRFQKEKI